MPSALSASYVPLSTAETVSLIQRLTRQGVPVDEAVEHVASINHVAKDAQQPARILLEDWLLKQPKNTRKVEV